MFRQNKKEKFIHMLRNKKSFTSRALNALKSQNNFENNAEIYKINQKTI